MDSADIFAVHLNHDTEELRHITRRLHAALRAMPRRHGSSSFKNGLTAR